MSKKTLTVVRLMSQRTNDQTLTDNLVAKVISPALAKGKGRWSGKAEKVSHKHIADQKHEFTFRLVFTKESGRMEKLDEEWLAIYAHVQDKGCPNSYWNSYPWKITGGDVPAGVKIGEPISLVQTSSDEEEGEKDKVIHGVTTIMTPSIITIEEMRDTFPHHLLGPNSDEEIAKHPAFCRIFGRNAQIRSLLSAVKSFLFTDGKRSSHTCLDGPAGCGKTQILNGLVKVWGEGCALRLDATATTKAGVEKMYFDDLPDIPPLCIMEEIEKAEETGLTVWLGALDDRKEIRKLNARIGGKVRKVNFLALCTSNNRARFDRMLEGALSSRFKNKWNCPRPDPTILKQILLRDIHENGGDEAWVQPCLELAEKVKTDDPRLVLAFLDGRERLLDKTYQKDLMEIHLARQAEAKTDPPPVLVQQTAA